MELDSCFILLAEKLSALRMQILSMKICPSSYLSLGCSLIVMGFNFILVGIWFMFGKLGGCFGRK